MREIHRFASLPSTMLKAIELAQAGCPSGTVVVANEQTAGQGRFGRSWHSEPGAGLYMSEVLRLKICPDSLPLVTLALGLATAEALTNLARHSGATNASVSLLRAGDTLFIEVRDNGGGGADATDGTGLAGLDDRAVSLGGSIHLDSPPGGPTILRAVLP